MNEERKISKRLTFDQNGYIIAKKVETLFYNQKGLLTKKQNDEGEQWVYEYNDDDKIIKEIDSEGVVWDYVYHDSSRIFKIGSNGCKIVSEKNGNRMTYMYPDGTVDYLLYVNNQLISKETFYWVEV